MTVVVSKYILTILLNYILGKTNNKKWHHRQALSVGLIAKKEFKNSGMENITTPEPNTERVCGTGTLGIWPDSLNTERDRLADKESYTQILRRGRNERGEEKIRRGGEPVGFK